MENFGLKELALLGLTACTAPDTGSTGHSGADTVDTANTTDTADSLPVISDCLGFVRNPDGSLSVGTNKGVEGVDHILVETSYYGGAMNAITDTPGKKAKLLLPHEDPDNTIQRAWIQGGGLLDVSVKASAVDADDNTICEESTTEPFGNPYDSNIRFLNQASFENGFDNDALGGSFEDSVSLFTVDRGKQGACALTADPLIGEPLNAVCSPLDGRDVMSALAVGNGRTMFLTDGSIPGAETFTSWVFVVGPDGETVSKEDTGAWYHNRAVTNGCGTDDCSTISVITPGWESDTLGWERGYQSDLNRLEIDTSTGEVTGSRQLWASAKLINPSNEVFSGVHMYCNSTRIADEWILTTCPAEPNKTSLGEFVVASLVTNTDEDPDGYLFVNAGQRELFNPVDYPNIKVIEAQNRNDGTQAFSFLHDATTVVDADGVRYFLVYNLGVNFMSPYVSTYLWPDDDSSTAELVSEYISDVDSDGYGSVNVGESSLACVTTAHGAENKVCFNFEKGERYLSQGLATPFGSIDEGFYRWDDIVKISQVVGENGENTVYSRDIDALGEILNGE